MFWRKNRECVGRVVEAEPLPKRRAQRSRSSIVELLKRPQDSLYPDSRLAGQGSLVWSGRGEASVRVSGSEASVPGCGAAWPKLRGGEAGSLTDEVFSSSGSGVF